MAQDNTTQTNQTDFELRAKSREVKQVNKTRLLIVIQVVVVAVFGMIAWSFVQGDRKKDFIDAKPSFQVGSDQKPEGLSQLPATYAKAGKADAGKEVLSTRNTNIGASYRKHMTEKEKLEARKSGLFFRMTIQRPPAPKPSTRQSIRQELDALTSGLSSKSQSASAQNIPGTLIDQSIDPNHQGRKIAFLNQPVDKAIYNTHGQQRPVSPYQLMAGTVISASLLSGLNSDLPGQVLAQVTEHIYDSVSGRHLLIPQGAKLIGKYDSVIAFGQERALVTWHRIILPNGTSVVIDNLPASDPAGYAGLKDKVDHHTWKLLKGIVFSTLLSVGTELTFGNDESDLVKAIRQATQQNANQAGQAIVQKNLNIQPTIKVRPGWPMRIIVNKDIVMAPYMLNEFHNK